MGSNKWKKRLGKAAALAAGIYGATRFGQARKKKALNAITAGDIASPKNYQIPDTDMGAIVKKDTIPEWARGAAINRGYGSSYYKKGGRVTGCAKRGFGRALKRK